MGIYQEVLKNAVLMLEQKYKNKELPVNQNFPDDLEYSSNINRARFMFLTELFPAAEKIKNKEEVSDVLLEGILISYAEQSHHNCFNTILGNEKMSNKLLELFGISKE